MKTFEPKPPSRINELTGLVTVAHQPPPSSGNLRDWWHGVLREHGRYSCYAVFLVLPNDSSAYSYFRSSRRELDHLTGEDCLVFALSKSTFRPFCEMEWKAAREQVNEGYSLQFAKIFDIDATQFPAVLFFKDVRSDEYVVVSLKDMSEKDISQKMRVIFKLIDQAVAEQKSPLEALEKNRKREALQHKGTMIVSTILTTAVPVTLQMALEAIFKRGLGLTY